MANTNFEPIWDEAKSIKGRMYGCKSQSEWDGYREEYKALLTKARLVFQMFSTVDKFNAFKARENDAILKIYTNVKQRWESDGKTNPITPPDWIIKELPKPSVANMNGTLVMYCQTANQLLANDSVNPEYRDNIDGYKQWYIDKLIKDYTPIMQQRHPDASVDRIKEVIKNIWNQCAPNFKIDE